MTYSATIQQLTNRIRRLETEMVAIRRELQQLPAVEPEVEVTTLPYAWANKTHAQKQMRQFLTDLEVTGQAIGSEALQAEMAQLALAPNELSASLIAAREE